MRWPRAARTLLLTLQLGLLVGACSAPQPAEPPREALRPAITAHAPTMARSLEATRQLIRQRVDAARIKASLQVLTALPCQAGSTADLQAARRLDGQLRAAGLDSRIEEYHVPLPYPLEQTVELLSPVAFRAGQHERALKEDFDTHGSAPAPQVAFAPDGEATAALVYVNRSRPEDYERLREEGLSVRGRIGIARQGAGHEGRQVHAAGAAELRALILYADPADHGYMRGDPYPQGPWLPGSGVRRCSALDIASWPGDPLTRGSPALDGVERGTWEETTTVPGIPVAVLSHEDARPLLESLAGRAAFDGWQGGLPFAYHVGGTGNAVAHVRVRSDWRLRPIWNVVAVLRGALLPDEWVVAGAPRDTWVRGAGGPSSATAVLLETARVMGELAREGRKPARSIVFCFFDGSRPGLLGSTEHLERHARELSDRAVCYVHVEALRGKALEVRSSALLETMLASSLGALADATEDGSLVRSRAAVEAAGPGTAAGSFEHHLGVPSLLLQARGPDGVGGTTFDTFGWLMAHAAPDAARHAALTRLLAVFLTEAAQATVHGLDVRAWGDGIAARVDELAAAGGGLPDEQLDEALRLFSESAIAFDEARLRLLASDPVPLHLKSINRTLRGLPRAFVGTPPFPELPYRRNQLSTPDPRDPERCLSLPALADALRRGDAKAVEREKARLTGLLRDLAARLVGLATACDARSAVERGGDENRSGPRTSPPRVP